MVISKNFMKISRYEVKNIINLLNLSDDDSIADCKSDSDCGPGQICVGIGLCVPKASVHSMRGQLPNLMKRYTPRF